MYEHIKAGDLVEITGMNYEKGKNNNIHLVIHKEHEIGFYCKCVFRLLNDKGKLVWFYANANDPYNDIKIAFED